MLPGYNHNVRYKDQVFHVQTEDSGVENPHIITHLFLGGNIIESRKTSYDDIVDSEQRDELVVDLMQGQHKGMLKDLIKGDMEEAIKIRSKNAAHLDGPAPINVAAGQAKTSFGLGTPTTQSPQPASKPTVAEVPVPAPPPPPSKPSTIHAPPPPAPAAPIAASAATPEVDESTGEVVIEAETLQRAFESKDESAVDSIFGEDLISEKSLDEVILSYLAEDMMRG